MNMLMPPEQENSGGLFFREWEGYFMKGLQKVYIVILVVLSMSMSSKAEVDHVTSADELIRQIINSEQEIHNVEVKMTAEILKSDHPLPFKINYEYEWGYEKGKEYYRGILNAIGADSGNWITQKTEVAYDGEKKYILRDTVGDDYVGGAVRSLKPNDFKRIVTPNTLLGFQAQMHGLHTLGEALLSASDSKITGEEEIDGHLCYVLENIDIRSSIEDSSCNVKVWIDKERDFRPLKFEQYRNYSESEPWKALLRRIDAIKLKKIDGIWYPVEGVRAAFLAKLIPPEGMDKAEFDQLKIKQRREVAQCKLKNVYPTRKLLVDENSIRINKGIPIEKFRVQFPVGCRVWDEYLQKGYVVRSSKAADHMLEQLANDAASPRRSNNQNEAIVSSDKPSVGANNEEILPNQGDQEKAATKQGKSHFNVLLIVGLVAIVLFITLSDILEV